MSTANHLLPSFPLPQLRESMTSQQARIDAARRESEEHAQQDKLKNTQLDNLHKQVAEHKRRADEEASHVVSERTKRQRSDDEVKVLNAKLDRYKSKGFANEELESVT